MIKIIANDPVFSVIKKYRLPLSRNTTVSSFLKIYYDEYIESLSNAIVISNERILSGKFYNKLQSSLEITCKSIICILYSCFYFVYRLFDIEFYKYNGRCIMKIRKYVILVAVLVVIFVIWLFNFKKDEDKHLSLFTYILSPKTYEGYIESEEWEEWYQKFVRELGAKCNYNPESTNFILNRQWLYYYEAIDINKITSVININIELIENNKKAKGAIVQKFKVSYSYLDINNKEFNLSDIYLITEQDNHITNFWVEPESNTHEMKGILKMQK